MRPRSASHLRFALWAGGGVILALIVLVFLLPCLLLLVVAVAGVAGYYGGRTALGGLLVGLALPVAWFGFEVGSRDRECAAGGMSADGVEFCTEWVPTGSIRWPWYVVAGSLLATGIALHIISRRRASSSG